MRRRGQTRAAGPPPHAPPPPPGIPIVGIGASAGGLDAFRRFLSSMPVPNGMAFVLLQHLDPTHESLMVELLAKHTAMKVVEVRQKMEVEPDKVYVIPPKKLLSLKEGVLHLVDPPAPARTVPRVFIVDFFFQSLAEDRREKAVGIILTGTGTDGTRGIRAIKAAGGMVMVQDPGTSLHDGMPRSAMGTGLVDYALPIERMPEALLGYVRHAYVNGGTAAEGVVEHSGDVLAAIQALLRARVKHDFRGYKKNSVLRRIQRRMGLSHIERLTDYLQFLQKTPAEVTRLFKDLLIGVTAFFRDDKAFEELRTKAIRRLIKEKDGDTPIRAWVVGCATGEEAYSLAMVLIEQLSAAEKHCPLQIFATDIDEEAVQTARAGVYPESISADVSAARLKRFFVAQEQNHTYHVAKSLRESVIFATQNVIFDAPFSKLDLISCRNLFIYLDHAVQRQLVRLFHFSLNPGGVLFLGSSETLGQDEEIFETVSKKWRIYRRQGVLLRPPEIPILSAQQTLAPATETPPKPDRQVQLATLVQQLLLDEYAPAAILANKKGDILYLHGATGRYLDLPSGEPALNVLGMTRQGLRSQLRIGIQKAVQGDATVTLEAQTKRQGKYCAVRLTIRPIRSPLASQNLMLIVFEDSPVTAPVRARGREAVKAADLEAIVRQLEAELKTTKDELRITVEQMDSASEELRASNEEVMSMNEELQSTNEELETSKEELQSLNEELSTVNSQLQERVQELTEANNDLANLLGSTEIATVFLDTEFRIKRFTEVSQRLLNLIRSDIGRPISDIAHNIIDVDLRRDAEEVLRRLTPIRREVEARSGEWFIMRVLPYRTTEGSVQGVVVTFSEVTDLLVTTRQLELRERQQEFVAALGRRALAGEPPERLMEDTATAVAQTVQAVLSCIFTRAAGEDILLLRAGTGWTPGIKGAYRLSTQAKSPIAQGFRGGAPLIIKDLRDDQRFGDRDLLADHGATSGVLVRIESRQARWGMLGVFTREARSFTQHDVNFLQAIAAVLAEAIQRKSQDTERLLKNQTLEMEVERRTAWLSLLQDITRAANEARSMDEALRYTLRRIGSYNGWQFGQSYVGSRSDPDVLVPFESWLDDQAPEAGRLHEACLRLRPRRGEGLVGRIMATGEIVLADRLDEAEDPVLGPLVRELDFKTVMVFPYAWRRRRWRCSCSAPKRRSRETRHCWRCSCTWGPRSVASSSARASRRPSRMRFCRSRSASRRSSMITSGRKSRESVSWPAPWPRRRERRAGTSPR
jgi:two-component system CheB/CheR fusion protein